MKTQEVGTVLSKFASLAPRERADELRKFAAVFTQGGDETIGARLKKLNKSAGYPAALKQSLEIIYAGLDAAGAKKQAADILNILSLFCGEGEVEVATFVQGITAPRAVPARKAPAAVPDHQLATKLADELTRTILDKEAFDAIVNCLNDPKRVNTPTLVAVAHRFLGHQEPYKGRKPPIAAIVKRQKSDAREYARGKALSRVGV